MQYDLQKSLLTDLKIGKKTGFKKPSSWRDIRKNVPDNCIRLFVDERYPIGFVATVTDGYSVDIDGEHYADCNSEAQFSMADWSEYTATDGYDISYPTGASKAHIIDIYPQTTGNNITAFKCQRVAASGVEQQGILWAHFNTTQKISCAEMFGTISTLRNTLLTAVTAKDNKLFFNSIYIAFYGCSSLEYLADLVGDGSNKSFEYAFSGCSNLEKITLSNTVVSAMLNTFSSCTKLTEIKTKNASANITAANTSNAYADCRALKNIIPTAYTSNVTNMTTFITNAISLQDTIFDVRNATGLAKIGCYGNSSYFISGLKGLRVSSSAPFSGSEPQIDVSYTGMDRTALVTLFNDLPTVTDGQILNITACTGSSDLTADDKAIATDKGWTVTL